MEYALFTFLTWLVLSIAGLPLSLTMLPNSLRKYSLQFAPLLGFGYFAFVSYHLYRMNIGGTDKYAMFLFLVPVVALVVLYARWSSVRTVLLLALNWEAALISGLGLVAMAVVSAPFFSAGSGHPLAMAMSNLDIAELAVVSRYLQEFVPNTQDGFMGQTGHLVWTCQDVWFGPSAIVAIVSSLLHAEPYQLQALVMDVIAVQAVGFVYLLARATLGFGRLGSTVLALLYAISPVPLFTIWQSFGGQMFAISLMLALFLVQTHSLKDTEVHGSLIRYFTTTVILLSGIILSYHFMLPISGMLLAGYFVCYAIFSRQWKVARNGGLLLIAAYLICAALNPMRIKSLFDSLAFLNGTNGWFIPWLSPDVILGANADTLFVGIGDLNDRAVWAAIAALPLLLTSWYLIRTPQAILARSFVVGLAVPTILVGFWYAYSEPQNGLWGSYRSFKITASFSALTLLSAAISFRGCSWRNCRPLAVLATFLVVIAASASWTSMRNLARFTQEHAFLPVPELRALKKIEAMPFVKGINVMDADNFSLLWTNYFTLRIRQMYQRFPYGGRPVGLLNQEYSLAKNAAAGQSQQGIFSVESSSFEAKYVVSSWYALYEPNEDRNVVITPAEGWWPSESTHKWSGSKDETISILKSYGQGLRWVSEPDEGQTHAINKGIKATDGGIIGWLNSDDVYYSGALKVVAKTFRDHPEVDVVYGLADHIDEADKVLEPYPVEEWNFERMKETCIICQPACFFRRTVVERHGLLDEKLNWCMDYEFWLRLGKQGVRFLKIPHKLAGSRMYADNKTLRARVKIHEQINDVMKSHFGRVPDRWIFNLAHYRLMDDNNSALNEKRNQRVLALYACQAYFKWRTLPAIKSWLTLWRLMR